ncbi:MAG: HAD family hydrolase [Pseudomonadota bacterium]
MDLDAILFDKDGTIFDFQATWGPWAARAIDQFAGSDASLHAALIKAMDYDWPAKRFFPTSFVIAGTMQEQGAKLAELLPGRTTNDIIEELNSLSKDVPQVPVGDIRDALSAVKSEGYRLGVMTNDAESSARVHLEQAGVSDLFDIILGYDSGFGAKPDPSPLKAAADQLGVPTSRTTMVGDSTHDLQAARAAGMRAIGVLTGPANRQELEPLAHLILPSIMDLPAALKSDASF